MTISARFLIARICLAGCVLAATACSDSTGAPFSIAGDWDFSMGPSPWNPSDLTDKSSCTRTAILTITPAGSGFGFASQPSVTTRCTNPDGSVAHLVTGKTIGFQEIRVEGKTVTFWWLSDDYTGTFSGDRITGTARIRNTALDVVTTAPFTMTRR